MKNKHITKYWIIDLWMKKLNEIKNRKKNHDWKELKLKERKLEKEKKTWGEWERKCFRCCASRNLNCNKHNSVYFFYVSLKNQLHPKEYYMFLLFQIYVGSLVRVRMKLVCCTIKIFQIIITQYVIWTEWGKNVFPLFNYLKIDIFQNHWTITTFSY